jgi:predicted enzyme related to lactoylglutathione lyase
MITGIHALIYSKHAEQMQGFLRDVLQWPSVDAGDADESWPIFAAPPTEIAVHPTDDEPQHQLYLMCDDIRAAVAKFEQRGVATTPIADRGWGLVTSVTLPGGESIGMYEPHHPSPLKKM